jgi:hypothetical protein
MESSFGTRLVAAGASGRLRRAGAWCGRTAGGAAMKKLLYLTYGFRTPTPEIMKAWSEWFASIKASVVDMAGLGPGLEISEIGTKLLQPGLDSITGYMIVTAESLDAAEKMAQGNPYITSIRVYELMSR